MDRELVEEFRRLMEESGGKIRNAAYIMELLEYGYITPYDVVELLKASDMEADKLLLFEKLERAYCSLRSVSHLLDCVRENLKEGKTEEALRTIEELICFVEAEAEDLFRFRS